MVGVMSERRAYMHETEMSARENGEPWLRTVVMSVGMCVVACVSMKPVK